MKQQFLRSQKMTRIIKPRGHIPIPGHKANGNPVKDPASYRRFQAILDMISRVIGVVSKEI